MNETDALHWHLYRYGAILSRQIDRLYNALEELERSTLLYLTSQANDSETAIDLWLSQEQFLINEDGFFQSIPLIKAYREGKAPSEAISFSWGGHLRHDRIARRHLYGHRTIGPQLQHIHERLGNVGWIYYQDAGNVALQYPFIDQATAISADFDWSTYHTFRSVCPENNPERQICWTAPSIDYAGEGLILSVSIPVWQDDRFLGLWSIDLPLRFLYQDFAIQHPFDDQQQWITDDRGLFLLHDKLQAEIDPQQGQLLLHPLSELGGDWVDFKMEHLQGEDGQLTMTDAEGIERIVAYLHIPKVNWTLFCSMPSASLDEAIAHRLEDAFQQIADGHYGSKIAPPLPTQ